MKFENIIIMSFIGLFVGLMFIIIIQSYELDEAKRINKACNERRLELINAVENNNDVIQDLVIANEKIYNPSNLPNGYDMIYTNQAKIEVK